MVKAGQFYYHKEEGIIEIAYHVIKGNYTLESIYNEKAVYINRKSTPPVRLHFILDSEFHKNLILLEDGPITIKEVIFKHPELSI